MKCCLYCVDQIHYWSARSVRVNCKSQHDVFAFDPESGTYCCEMAPSYGMYPLYGTFVLKDHAKAIADDAMLEQIDDAISGSQRTDVMYIHQSVVDRYQRFKLNEIPSELPGHFVIEWGEDDDIEELEEFFEEIIGNPPI